MGESMRTLHGSAPRSVLRPRVPSWIPGIVLLSLSVPRARGWNAQHRVASFLQAWPLVVRGGAFPVRVPCCAKRAIAIRGGGTMCCGPAPAEAASQAPAHEAPKKQGLGTWKKKQREELQANVPDPLQRQRAVVAGGIAHSTLCQLLARGVAGREHDTAPLAIRFDGQAACKAGLGRVLRGLLAAARQLHM